MTPVQQQHAIELCDQLAGMIEAVRRKEDMVAAHKLGPIKLGLESITVAEMRVAAKVWRIADRCSVASTSTHDRIDDLIDEIERLRGLI